MTSSTPSAARVRLADIPSIVARAKQSGLILGAGEARPVKKDGTPAAALNGVRSQWMNIDPALARAWLQNNFRNRPISDDVVDAFARDMRNGVWVATHQGVAFNDRDELIDGQHRLHAIVKSDCTVRMMVTFGLPAQIEGSQMTTMDAVDRGRTRSVADQLRIQHGLKDGAAIAQIVAQIANLCNQARTRRLSVGQSLEIYRLYEATVIFVIERRRTLPGLRQAGVLAAFAFALATETDHVPGEGPIARMFADLMATRCKADGPARLLQDFLLSDAAKLLCRGQDRALAELVLQAIHLERAGRKIEKLELATEGADAFRAAQAARVEKVAAMFRLPGTEGGK